MPNKNTVKVVEYTVWKEVVDVTGWTTLAIARATLAGLLREARRRAANITRGEQPGEYIISGGWSGRSNDRKARVYYLWLEDRGSV